MEFDTIRDYLLTKPFATEDFPFGESTHVFKVHSKMFALMSWRNDALMVNVKCDPEDSFALREIFSNITTGYHMDKKHWISIYLQSTGSDKSKESRLIPDGEVLRIIDNSYLLVVDKLPKKHQTAIKLLL
ncbi:MULTISPECIES: MmcQ/YjbR family DNA-binding protein [unclassified Shewanella]|uniref:MmcQ/YjbR family DNA-binding protein n=1 Tax=unclassified Shewanella TaxID=196818 RepID=UPI0006D68AB9|nr:MmcQ/YjbR family DNA-binding protein [Shewanella sp. P1-14-1]KPZ72940.1 hypothetical protein AN944_00629 [Shewanella sp. P1-14-1]